MPTGKTTARSDLKQWAASVKEMEGGTPWEVVYSLFTLVGLGQLSMNAAQQTLREKLLALSEEERAEWKKSAADFARRLIQIAEAFQEEITVMSVRT